MDMLFYLLIIGAGIAASQPGYDYDASSSYEQPADDSGFGMNDDDDGSDDPVRIAPPFEPAPDQTVEAPEPQMPDPPPAAGYAAEDQTATGRMTTATEVRPILSVTKPSWVAVREYDGNDLLYFTNLLAWRCGLHEIGYSVNGGPVEVLAMEPCYSEEGAPNALKVQDVLPYVTLPLGSVQSVTVQLLYDDLSTDTADYPRDAIKIN